MRKRETSNLFVYVLFFAVPAHAVEESAAASLAGPAARTSGCLVEPCLLSVCLALSALFPSMCVAEKARAADGLVTVWVSVVTPTRNCRSFRV